MAAMITMAQALEDGTAYEEEWERGTLSTDFLADLVLPSGYIVACDAIVNGGAEPFAKRVTPGRYPVLLSLACPTTGDFAGGENAAFAWVRLGSNRPVRWEMATRPGEDLASLDPNDEDSFFGYPVDSAHGCFMDQTAQRLIDGLSPEEDEAFTAALIAEMQRERAPDEGGTSKRTSQSIWRPGPTS